MEGAAAVDVGSSTVETVDAVMDSTTLLLEDNGLKEEPPFKKIKLEEDEAPVQGSMIETPSAVLEPSSTLSNVSNLDVKEEPTSAFSDEVLMNTIPSTNGMNPPKIEESLPENDDDDDLFGGDDDDNGDENNVKDAEGAETGVSTAIASVEPHIAATEHTKSETYSQDPTISGTVILKTEANQKFSENQETVAEASIPRKSSSASKPQTPMTNSISSPPQKQHFTPGTRYGLPPGVNVPVSIVRTKLLEVEMNTPGSKLMDVLKSLPVNLINDALSEYDDAVEIKGANSIRNHGAYLYGVVKRYVSVHERSLKGEGSGILPMGEDGLTDLVQERLEQLVTAGFCSTQEMNDKVKSKIRMLSEKDAIFALDELSSVERASIRNFGSYFMGILNRYMRGDASSKIRPSFNPGGPSQHHPKQGHAHRDRDRFPPPHQYSSSSSNRNPSNPRDRFDNRGPPMGGMPRSPPYPMDNAYDYHQQPSSQLPGWPNQQPHHLMGGAPAMQQGGGMAHFSMNNANPIGSSIVNSGQSMSGMPQSFQHQQPYGQQQPPYMQQQNQPFGHQSGYPPNTSIQQSISNSSSTGVYQNNMMGQPQSHVSSQQLHPQYPSQQQPPLMNQPSQFVSDSQGSIDILGLADKAASAIQALGANKLNAMGQGYPTQHLGVAPPHQQQPQQQGYSPYASGMQPAMGQHPQMGMQPQMNLPPQQPYLAPNQQFGASGSLNRSDAPMNQGNRRRTTASFNELPVTVQYALQVRFCVV
jgi:Heterogeneous nuclear ribonucleoprotein Q acidic domain